MSRRLYIGVGVLILGFLLLVGAGLLRPPSLPDIAITGYDGIESTTYDVIHPYDPALATLTGIGGTSLTFDPFGFTDPNGVHIDIQEPNVLSFEQLDTIEKQIEETRDGEKYIVTKTWDVMRVTMEMMVHLYTTGTGFAPIVNTQIMIRLTENGYSVFMLPDESEAYILNVYTTKQTEQSGGLLNQVAPLAGGMDVGPLETIEHADIPQWILDSGYTGQLSNLKDVAFPITIVQMQRLGFIEAENKMWFGIDVLLFGYWEEWKPYREGIYEFPDWLGDLFLMLMTPFGIALAIVAIIGTMVVLVKAPGYFLKVFGVVAIWLAVFFVLMLFGVAVL